MMANLVGPGPGGQGPAISGKFFHKDTGKEIFVRDSINDGVKMCVVLSDGTTMDMSEFQNYVQMSDEEYDSQGRLIGKAKDKPKPNLDPNLLFAGMDNRLEEKNDQSKEVSSITKQVNIFESRIVFSFIGKLFVILIVLPSREILDDEIDVIAPTNKIKK